MALHPHTATFKPQQLRVKVFQNLSLLPNQFFTARLVYEILIIPAVMPLPTLNVFSPYLTNYSYSLSPS